MQPIKVHIMRKALKHPMPLNNIDFPIATGPNPWKPILILEELGLPYELNSFGFEQVKQKPFIDINPNGRVPGDASRKSETEAAR